MKNAGNLSGSDLEEFYMNMKSGAESGWDFSTRWFINADGSNEGGIENVKIRDIVPVDLNAFICMNAQLLSKMFGLIGDEAKSQLYRDKFLEWKEAIQMVSIIIQRFKKYIASHSQFFLIRYCGMKKKESGWTTICKII